MDLEIFSETTIFEGKMLRIRKLAKSRGRKV